MFMSVFGFELKYLFRRPGIYFFAGLFLVMTLSAVGSDSVQMGGGIGNSARNSPYEIMNMLSLMSAIALLVLTGFVATAVNRDHEYQAYEIFASTPVRTGPYLAGRFFGSLVASLAVVVAAAFGIVIGTAMPWLDPARILPFDIRPYAYSLAVFAIPNLFVMGVFLFSFATLTRKVFVTYVAMLGVLMAYGIGQALMRDLENRSLASLLDPFGMSVLRTVTQYWTVVERNTLLPPLEGTLLLNRLVWIGVGAAVLAFTCARFRMRVTEAAPSRRWRRRRAEPQVAVAASTAVAVPRATLSYSTRDRLLQLLDQTRVEVAGVVRSVPFLVILLFGVFNLCASLFIKEQGTTPYPLTRIALATIEGSYDLFLFIVLLVYSGQLVWRERQARMNEIHDALPVPDWIPLASKFAALAVVTVIGLAIAMAAAILAQVSKGYFNLEIGMYLRGLFVVSLSWWLTIAALMLAMQTFVNNKIVGFGILLIYYILVDVFPALGVDHHLFIYGTAPDVVYSDMNGYGFYLAPLVWFKTYWGLASAALMLAAVLFWGRGTDVRRRFRFAEARRRLTAARGWSLAALIVGFVATGGWIYYNTNVLNEWMSAKRIAGLQASYEQRYKQYEHLPQPRITAVAIEADIYPEKRRVDVRGTYALRNKTATPIRELHLVIPEELELTTVSLPGEALTLNDGEVGYRIYRLGDPLEPGEEMAFRFEGSIVSRGFRDRNFLGRVAGNGTFLENSQCVPHIGYDASQELSDPHERRKHELAEATSLPDPSDPGALDNTMTSDADWVSFEATLSTSPDQAALTVGELEGEWEEGGRRYFRYASKVPILDFYPILSGRYDVVRDEWNGVAIEVYHHPGHAYNVARMIESAKRSLDYYTVAYSPYQNSHLRIVEFPRFESFAQSFSGIIPYSESAHFIEDLRGEKNIDMVFYITAHEIAHQWWGHQVAAAWARGGTFIEESMAQYSALMVMEKDYGRDKMERFLKYELDRYLSGRAAARKDELPLALCELQSYVYYQKGSLATYALRDYVGEERLNEALRGFVTRHAFQGPPYPGSTEFVSALREATPDQYKYMVEDAFETITLYDNRCESVAARDVGDGRYEVTLAVSSRKVRSDGKGVETEVPEDDWIEIGVYGEKGDADEAPFLYLGKHRFTGGAGEVSVVVDGAPARAGIDPRHLLIDRVPDDNVKKAGGDIKGSGDSACPSVSPFVRIDS